MDAGMSENEAVYSAFDDLMAQDKETQSIIFRAYAETLSEYQGQGEENVQPLCGLWRSPQ